MNILGLIVKLLFADALSSHAKKRVEAGRKAAIEQIENVYMNYFRGPIADPVEQQWILENKIRPMITKMNEKEIKTLLTNQAKNEKLIKKGKPAKYIIVKDSTIREYNLEYLKYKREKEVAEIRRAKEQAEAEREQEVARLRSYKMRQMREAEILVSGESDAEVAERLFS